MPVSRVTKLGIQSRGFITALIGEFDDVYLDSDLRKYSFNQQLYLYLKKEGFEKIVFYDRSDGLFSYEKESLEKIIQPKEKVVPSNGDGRPLGSRGRLNIVENNSQRLSIIKYVSSISTNFYQIKEVKDDALFGKFKSLIEDPSKTILIFNSTEVNINNQDEMITYLQGINEHWASATIRNKILINYHKQDQNQLIYYFKNDRSKIFSHEFFRNIFLISSDNENFKLNKASTVLIEKPQKDEISNVLNYLRILYNPRIEWSELPEIKDSLDLQNNKLLKTLITELQELKTFNLSDFLSSGLIKTKEIAIDYENIISNCFKSIKGQDENIEHILEKLRLWVRMKNRKSPISFFSVGPSGVGKTLTAQILAENLKQYGYEFVKINMNEFQEQHSSSKLIGAGPGYVGYGDEPILFAEIKKNSRLIICFDEIEKADSSILKVIMQLVDEGILSHNNYRGNFTECIIFFTSNLAQEDLIEIKQNFQKQYAELTMLEIVRKPEFLKEVKSVLTKSAKVGNEIFGRMKNVVVYNTLGEKHIIEIALKEIRNFAGQYDYNICNVDPQYLARLAREYSHNPFGIRDLKNGIENDMTELIKL